MAGGVTLEEYLDAERGFEARGARIGFVVHAVITVLVSAALIAINVIVAPDFPWSPFPVVGMAIGLVFHYLGSRRIEATIAERQTRIVTEAARRAA
jgi:hypothetical protein